MSQLRNSSIFIFDRELALAVLVIAFLDFRLWFNFVIFSIFHHVLKMNRQTEKNLKLFEKLESRGQSKLIFSTCSPSKITNIILKHPVH